MPRKPSPQGTPRLRLSASFLESLAKDFEKHRDEVVEAFRRESPKAYAELLGRLVMTADPPAEEKINSMEDVGRYLLKKHGVLEPARGRTPAAWRFCRLFTLSLTLRISLRSALLTLTLPMDPIRKVCRSS
jgi:hypothetical protein